ATRRRCCASKSSTSARRQGPPLPIYAVVERQLLALDHLVTLTGAAFQHPAIEYRHVPAAVSDGTSLLKLLRQQGHSRAAYAKHLGQEILGEWQLKAADVICALQQPTTKARRGVMDGVAGSDLLRLHPQHFGIAGDHFPN